MFRTFIQRGRDEQNAHTPQHRPGRYAFDIYENVQVVSQYSTHAIQDTVFVLGLDKDLNITKQNNIRKRQPCNPIIAFLSQFCS